MAAKSLKRWADVPGYEGLYQVSTEGRVRSLDRRRMTGAGIRTVRGRVLRYKPGLYPSVTLTHLNDNKTWNVHSLVLLAFVGPRPEGMEACHFDGNKWNPRLDNLRWDTPSGNHCDRVRHGVSNRGERCGGAKLTASDVTEIRKRQAAGARQRELSAEYGVSQAQISNIINRKGWANVRS